MGNSYHSDNYDFLFLVKKYKTYTVYYILDWFVEMNEMASLKT